MRARGYTLLEVVVVLALLGLAVGMAAPAGFRMVASWREASDIDAVLRQLAALPMTARTQGRALGLPADNGIDAATDAGDADAAVPMELPDGWVLEMDTPLVVQPNGACNDAGGRLRTLRQTVDFTVEAPFCRIRRHGE